MDLGECFRRKRQTVTKGMAKWAQSWKEKEKWQSTTGIRARMDCLMLINDLQEGTQEHLQIH